jgi:hypothetical protein
MIPDHPFIISELAEQRRNEIREMVKQERMGRKARPAQEQRDAQVSAKQACVSGAKALVSRLQEQWSSSLKRYILHPDH